MIFFTRARALAVFALAICFVASLLACIPAGAAAPLRQGVDRAPASAISMAIQAGWANYFRAGGAWVPVRATVRNSGDRALDAWLEVPDSAIAAAVQLRVHAGAVYRRRIVLPPG